MVYAGLHLKEFIVPQFLVRYCKYEFRPFVHPGPLALSSLLTIMGKKLWPTSCMITKMVAFSRLLNRCHHPQHDPDWNKSWDIPCHWPPQHSCATDRIGIEKSEYVLWYAQPLCRILAVKWKSFLSIKTHAHYFPTLNLYRHGIPHKPSGRCPGKIPWHFGFQIARFWVCLLLFCSLQSLSRLTIWMASLDTLLSYSDSILFWIILCG